MKKFDPISLGLIVGILAVTLMLVRQWDQFQIERQQQAMAPSQSFQQNQLSQAGASDLPAAPVVGSNAQPLASDLPAVPGAAAELPITPASSQYTLQNDLLKLTFSALGGDLVDARLLQHYIDLESREPIQLLIDNGNRTYVAQTGLVGQNGTDTAEGRPLFSAAQPQVIMSEGQDRVSLDLVYQTQEALITKRFSLNRGDYYIEVDYLVENLGTSTWSAAYYAQIKRDSFEPVANVGVGVKPFVGFALTSPDNRYDKYKFKDLDSQRVQMQVDQGWVAMLQHYYLTALLPDSQRPLNYNLRASSQPNTYLGGFTQSALSLAPGATGEINAGIYIGPKDQYRLKEIAEHLDLTIDYGWIWWAAQPVYAVLNFLHTGEYSLLGFEGVLFSGFANWGICIILLTLLVKLAFFRLSAASYRSMAKMRKLQPKMTALKERLGDDKQAFSQEMMKLYQKEKVNPMGGCLPMLIQMPVFIALYWVLLESVEIRHEPFFLWIVDLSAKDPWFILPLIMGASMWFQMRLNPTPPDPTQAKVMQMMPIMFTFLFMWFPAGLVLYWVSNNLLSIAQQLIITRSIENADSKPA